MSPVMVRAPEGGGADFEPCPAGMMQGVCAFVVPIGEEYSEKYNSWSNKLVIVFEMAEKMADGRPFMLSLRYTMSLGKKASLRRDLEAWRGRDFTDEELKGFDVEKLIGVNATLNVIHRQREGGGVTARIVTIGPPMKGMPKLEVFNKKHPEWIDKEIEKNSKAAGMRKAAEASGINVGAVIDHPPAGFDDPEVPF